MSKGGSSPQSASEWASAQSNAQITTWHAQDLYSSSIGSQERFNSLSLEQLGSISTPWALPSWLVHVIVAIECDSSRLLGKFWYGATRIWSSGGLPI